MGRKERDQIRPRSNAVVTFWELAAVDLAGRARWVRRQGPVSRVAISHATEASPASRAIARLGFHFRAIDASAVGSVCTDEQQAAAAAPASLLQRCRGVKHYQ